MSKSVRKHPCLKFGKSDKKDKVFAHRKFRNRERRCLHRLAFGNPFGETFPHFMREVSDNWAFPSDGLALYIKHPWEGMMRK